MRTDRDIHGVWHDCSHHFHRQLSTLSTIQYKISFYIQVGMVTAFIIAFLFLSNKKLDSRRDLTEELNEAMIEHYQDSVVTSP